MFSPLLFLLPLLLHSELGALEGQISVFLGSSEGQCSNTELWAFEREPCSLRSSSEDLVQCLFSLPLLTNINTYLELFRKPTIRLPISLKLRLPRFTDQEFQSLFFFCLRRQ